MFHRLNGREYFVRLSYQVHPQKNFFCFAFTPGCLTGTINLRGDATLLENHQKEIDAFVEYMVDGVEKSDDDIPFEEIRKARNKSRLKDVTEK